MASTGYNASSLDVLLNKLVLRNQDPGPIKTVDTDIDIESAVAQFKQVIIQSAVDLACRQQANSNVISSLHANWEEIRAQVIDTNVQDTYSIPAPQRLKTDYEFKVTQLMAAYADVVKNNFAGMSEAQSSLSFVQEFTHVENTCSEYGRESFELIWNLLEAQMSGLGKEVNSEEGFVTLVENTCKFLELSYSDKINQVARKTSRRLPLEQVKDYCNVELSSIVSKL